MKKILSHFGTMFNSLGIRIAEQVAAYQWRLKITPSAAQAPSSEAA